MKIKVDLNKPVDKNLTLKVIEYCLKTEKVFLNVMYKDMNLNHEEAAFVRNYLITLDKNTGPNHILSKANADVGFNPDLSQLHLLPSALFSYIDHLEIIEARKASAEAKRLSLNAIWISIGSIVLGTIIGGLQLWFQLHP